MGYVMIVDESNLKKGLLSLRLGVFTVFIMWTIDKFVNPEHAAAVFRKYYLISGLGESVSYILGGLQLIIVLCFLLGIRKKFSYGLLFVLHFISTVSCWQMYINPWGPKNLLFFAAFPMLAALYVLYLFRNEDTLLNLKLGE